jgi:hypothetical protein
MEDFRPLARLVEPRGHVWGRRGSNRNVPSLSPQRSSPQSLAALEYVVFKAH